MTKHLLAAARLGCVLLMAATAPIASAADEAAANEKSPTPNRRLPNILFCIADDASPHFGAYGCTWVKTPNIDRLAAGGITFTSAYTPTAKCAPSRAALLTGRYPWLLEEAANHQSFFPPQYKSFTEVLAESGCGVGAQGKFWGPGIAKNADGTTRTWGLISGTSKKGDEPGVGFKNFLAARPKDKPFFYWFGSQNPHRPYKPDIGLAAGKQPSDIDRVPKIWPDNDTVRRDMLDYAIEIERYDAEVGALLKVLEESGEAENTLVIVTSDHGMPFPRVKGHNYHASNHVPLVARWPQGIAKPGRRAEGFVSLIDLAPTFLELLGLDGDKAATAKSTGMAKIYGKSLTDVFAGELKHDRSVVLLGRERNDVLARPGTEHGLGYPVRGIREGNLLYLVNFTAERWPCGDPELGLLDTDASPTKKWIEELRPGDKYWELCFGKRPEEELFDVASDPDCVVDLATAPMSQERKGALREKMFALLRDQADPRILNRGDVFDRYPSVKAVGAKK